MKVKCLKIYNEHTKKYENESPWLTVGKEYLILAIEVYNNRVLYLLVGDNTDNSPSLQNALQFEIISEKIPKNWELISGNLCLFILGPKVWRNVGFWESCYNNDPAALEIYKREAKIIYEEENT
jgi:hypothetical protein